MVRNFIQMGYTRARKYANSLGAQVGDDRSVESVSGPGAAVGAGVVGCGQAQKRVMVPGSDGGRRTVLSV
ncbi:hypothetical protein K437DRAFT_256994 [Tilletiaria anomala UBC 951]|uniref:Uncharacterized protein n=1 Tax=Tilletiaria anomala (strain ATCC 24038 / CBS 436.72 / UBC 951) TaxID=1037660 RepID=A0A066VSW2_TILAU|nr:uncharacterized protein K437DRAFT_256994 [Tilletiaria anomala UBC 951]KDN44561.1 hypothetical protein K437DRAFT_256994 [Tilletiaria anomala UBC 951]